MSGDVKLEEALVWLVGFNENANSVVAWRCAELEALLPRSGYRISRVQHGVDENRADGVGFELVGSPKAIRVRMIDQKRGHFAVGPDESLGYRDPVGEIESALD